MLFAGAAATAAAILLLAVRFPWIAGPPSWRWPFASVPLWPRAAWPAFLFALLAGVAALSTRGRGATAKVEEEAGARGAAGAAAAALGEAPFLAATVLLAVLLDLAFIGLSPLGMATLPLMHLAPWVTGYFWSARAAQSLPEMLATYPEVVTRLVHHARTHPPGLVAVNRLVLDAFRGSPGAAGAMVDAGRWIGIPRGAVSGLPDAEIATLVAIGLATVVIGRLAIVPAHALARRLYGPPAARAAALLLAVVPSWLLFAGEFDAIYPLALLSALLLVGRGRGRLAVAAAGAVVGAACLLTFVATVLLGLVALADWLLGEGRPFRERALRAALLGAGFALPLAAFGLATGASIPRVFLAAYTVQQEVLIPEQNRRWLTWVVWNLEDFFLFLGPATAALFIREAAAVVSEARARRAGDRFALALLLFIALLDLSGLVPAETSRVWLFLAPPVVAVAVRRGPPCGRAGLLLLLGLAFAFALAAKGNLLMIDVMPRGVPVDPGR